MTPLDTAHAAMDAAPEDEALRRRYYVALAAAELFVPLESQEPMRPIVIDAEGTSFALAFDSDVRLASFAGEAVERAVMSGRALVAALTDSGLGIGINLGVADSAMLVPPAALGWMREADIVPTVDEAVIGAILPPDLGPEALELLNQTLAGMTGLARHAYLVRADPGNLLIIEGAEETAQDAIAARIGEALALGGSSDAITTLFTEDQRLLSQAAGSGMRFDLPQAAGLRQEAPGSDPARPPKLR